MPRPKKTNRPPSLKPRGGIRGRRWPVPSSALPTPPVRYNQVNGFRIYSGLYKHDPIQLVSVYRGIDREYALEWLWQVQKINRWSDAELSWRSGLGLGAILRWKEGSARPSRLSARVISRFAVAHMSRRRVRWLDKARPKIANVR